MRSADVVKGATYAVKVPIMRYGRRDGSKIDRAEAVRKLPSGKWELRDAEGGIELSPAAFIEPWADYQYKRDYDEAVREDQQRTWRIEYDRECAAFKARVERVSRAFDGVEVDQRALGVSSNTATPLPVDLGEWLREGYTAPGTSQGTITIDLMEALAGRLLAAQDAVLAASGGWAAGPEPIIDGQREVVHLAPAASDVLARLAAAAEDAE